MRKTGMSAGSMYRLVSRLVVFGTTLPLAPLALAQASDPAMLAPVVVTATRSEQASFDLPLSIDRIGEDAIRQGNAMVNLSESLNRVPGIVVRNRQNYAQDLQITSRGFGARSTFGVRGVRLYADGIPATMPDGQGQTSNFDLASAARIEVLRGPFSALYGNSSGGVISVFTEDGAPGLKLSPFAQIGSYGTTRFGVRASGQRGNLNHVTSISRFDTDGYRRHSAATRDVANARLRITPGADSSLTLIGNAVSMPDVQDPLGLTRSQFETDPRSAHPNALLYNTRKSVRQQQLGLNWEKALNPRDTIHAMAYGGRRATEQVLSVPPAAQAAPTSAGGVIDLERDYGGIDLRWTREHSDTLRWSAGVSIDTLGEDRRGYENFSGATLGVQGRLRRDERNRVRNVDQYLQAQWEPDPRWLLLAGIRNSRVSVRSNDRYIAPGNGDDSGAARYHALTPVLGATYRMRPDLNLYASYGQGFETPTLNELSYRPGTPAAAGFNFDLRPAKSDNVEFGVKTSIRDRVRLNLAAFHVDTSDELTILSSSGGRAVYRNAGETRRRGLEAAVEGNWPNGLGILLSWSLLDARYTTPFCSGACTPATQVAAGNRIPGVPRQTVFGELSWRDPASGMSMALEALHVGKVFVDDTNSDAAPSHTLANLRISFEQQAGAWRISEFLRIDNITDRRHAGSVIVNESNGRFFEPGPGRNYLVGISAAYAW
jgi:iron complex outermembrane receptor protein